MTTLLRSPVAHTTAGGRVFNFSAGPGVLPEEVLQEIQQDVWDLRSSGIGILEHTHRGVVFDQVIAEAIEDCRRLGGVPDDHEVLFLPGGATLHFAMVPMNFLPADGVADYVDTGMWAHKAMREAAKVGAVHCAFDGTKNHYTRIPADSEIQQSAKAAYLHYCSNNTIFGTRFDAPPATSAPLVVDMSSEAFARPHDIARHAMMYAGAQKNLGPAGIVLAIIRKDFLERACQNLPVMLSYVEHAKGGSRLNTPNTFGIYVMGRVFKWIERQGGLTAMERLNAAKARIVYDAIDVSGGFYRGHAQPECRSHMNIPFRLPTPELDERFVREAEASGMANLKGHRDAGGVRASIYNAFPVEGCRLLASFMGEFASRHG
jgi:phosphoserine aminotransferase